MATATVRIPAEKRDILRIIAGIEKTEMKEILSGLIDEYIERHKETLDLLSRPEWVEIITRGNEPRIWALVDAWYWGGREAQPFAPTVEGGFEQEGIVDVVEDSWIAQPYFAASAQADRKCGTLHTTLRFSPTCFRRTSTTPRRPPKSGAIKIWPSEV